jgi:hypothetical protein
LNETGSNRESNIFFRSYPGRGFLFDLRPPEGEGKLSSPKGGVLELEAAEEAAEEAEEEGAEEASELAEPLELKADDKMSLLRSGARTSMRPKT